jgi:hypothetical protein
MLLKTNITDIQIHSPEWFQGRLAKFTASEWYAFMGDKFLTTGAKSYIYLKVGEELTGISSKEEVDTKGTEHGKMYEEEGIRAAGSEMGWEFVVTQKLITEKDSRYGCTPDFLLLLNESVDKKMWNVITGEVKCPASYNAFIKLALCQTPLEILAAEPRYFWQVCMQMKLCDALRGYLIIYHPFFKVGGLNIIEFRKIELMPQFKLLEERMKLAEQEFDRVRTFLMNSKFKKYKNVA